MSTIEVTSLSDQAKELYGVDIDRLIIPFSDTQPCGPYLKYEDVYFDIQQARTADDSSLPLGVWGHDLKKAEWNKVIDLCAATLNTKSKDIQLGVWLLEAGIHRFGFVGIAPALHIIYCLCEHFWEQVHPQVEHDDLEYRINPIVWANEKLLPALRLIPITKKTEEVKSYCWSDWLQASEGSASKPREGSAFSKDEFILQFKRVGSDALVSLSTSLSETLSISEELVALLDKHCMEYAPSLGHIQELVGEVKQFVDVELRHRGLQIEEPTPEPLLSSDPLASTPKQEARNLSASDEFYQYEGRNKTYRDVEQAAQTLLKIDPHSPAPYLILQACRWGTMDTRELYKELFVECGGQLNIFELLGVDSSGMPAQGGQ